MSKKQILAFVGMPGSGKSLVASYLQKKGLPFVRFGDLTKQEIARRKLTLSPENEQVVRESIRQEFGMAAFATKAKPKIKELFLSHDTVAIDGMYSWEEYLFLKETFSYVFVIHIFANRSIRYERLAKRKARPFTTKQAQKRDFAEIEKLNKGGPIAIADYLIDNTSDNKEELYKKIDKLLLVLGIKNG
ncbi:MAG: AAA family ATPase [Candidatus Levybacteria bacterium]|nr:AAA family ATPase [Candidatus Levybacteria bacterium]